MAKKKHPKSCYRAVGNQLVFNWLFPRNTASLFNPPASERKPKIYPLGRLALYDGGVGLLAIKKKRKAEAIPEDFTRPFPPLEFPPLEEWGLEEWRDYALLQQDLAEALQQKLGDVWGELAEATDKLSRRKPKTDDKKPPKAFSGGLLNIGDWKKRRGRPIGSVGISRAEDHAQQVIRVQQELQLSSERKVTVPEALDEYKNRLGPIDGQAIGVSDRTIQNKISEIKKSR
jgi:hypothetical protein